MTRLSTVLSIALLWMALIVDCHSRSFYSPCDHPGILSLESYTTHVALSLQGGAVATKATPKTKKQVIVSSKHKKKEVVSKPVVTSKNAVMIAATAMTSYGLWVSRTSWMGFFNKEKLLKKTLEILHHLDSKPKVISYSVYMLGMAIWEALGLSTIPVETASGMVFGWTGFYLSAIGKLLGAVTAFCLARYGVLAAFIHEKLSKNHVLKLLEDSAESHPFRVAVLMKLSCFPETIKNYGSALLQPIRLWMFTIATVAHGWTFSALWTYLGVDTAMRLVDSELAADGKLQILLTLALINGVVVSPLAMGFWLKSLKQPQQGKT